MDLFICHYCVGSSLANMVSVDYCSDSYVDLDARRNALVAGSFVDRRFSSFSCLAVYL